MALELVGPMIEIFKCVVPSMWGCIQYYRQRNTLVKVLDDLKSQKEQIEQKLKEQRRPGKLPKSEVEEWLTNVKKITDTENVDDMVQRKNICSGASLGKDIDQEIRKAKRYQRKGRSFSDDLVIDATARGTPLPTKPLVGAKKYIDEIWRYLMEDEEVMKIGVCGMSGVGKTAIVKHINNKLLKESHIFDYIIWVNVSQVVDYNKLRQNLANALDEKFQETADEERGQGILSKMLEGKKVVLILDDVWEEIELDKLGFHEPIEENGCKLVITTRSLDICRVMSCERVKVDLLSKSEQLELFLHEAELHVARLPSSKEMELVNGVVDRCAGLPHAIVTVARRMRRQYDKHEWMTALSELSDSSRKVDLMGKVFEKLELSYDALKGVKNGVKVQHCLLYCALFPENYDIPKNELMNFWIVEGFVEEMENLQDREAKAHSIMNQLINSFLLLESTDFKEIVKLHGIVRDMVLMHVTRESPLFMVKAGKLKERLPPKQDWKEDFEKISLMHNSIKEIPSNLSPNCPVLSTLLLQGNPLERIPETFFRNMHGLKILNLSKTRIRNLPNSISGLSNLTTLSLKNCPNLTYVPSLAKLSSLEYFVASDCENLVEISHEEGKKELKLPGLRMLSLKNMPELKSLCGSNGVMFCDSIQKFEIYNCPKLKKIFSSKVQVGLENLEEIVVEYCGEMEKIIELDFYTEPITVPKLRNLILRWMPKLKSICGSHGIMAGDHLQKIEISNCSKLRKILSQSSFSKLKRLEEIAVSNCDKLEEMIAMHVDDKETITKELSVPKLESLSLKKMRHLKSICGSNGVMRVSESLQKIEIDSCPGLRKILSLSKGLVKLTDLEEICLSNCDEVEEVITLDSDNNGKDNKELDLSKLTKLILRKMPKLKSVCGNHRVIVGDSLQKIEIRSCDKMEELIAFGLDKEDKRNKELSLPKLTSLILDCMPNLKTICGNYRVIVGDSLQKIEIWSCPVLKMILSPSKLQLELKNLEVIHVDGCEQMKEIFTIDAEKDGTSGKELSLSKLTKLILVSMPNLKSICGNKGVRVGYSLQNIEIKSCPMLKKVLSISKLLVALESLEEVDVRDCGQIEEMITTGAVKKEKIVRELRLPKLTRLILRDMRELKSIYESNGIILVGDSLKEIKVETCPKLRKIITPSKSQLELKNLEDIEVEHCEEIKEIIGSNVDIERAERSKQQFTLSKLKKLRLRNIERLESICGRYGVMVGDSLEQIDVRDCPMLRKIISPSKSLRELKRLEEIKVKHCEKLEEIIASNVDPEEKVKKELSLPKLRELTLYKMPNLRSINCGSNSVMVCETIKTILVSGCPSLEDLHLKFPLDKNGQPLSPVKAGEASLPKQDVPAFWCYFDEALWDSMKWDHPNAKAVILPFCFFDSNSIALPA